MSEQENNPNEHTEQDQEANREATEASGERKLLNVCKMFTLEADEEGMKFTNKEANEGDSTASLAASFADAHHNLEQLYEAGIWKDYPETEQKVGEAVELLNEMAELHGRMAFPETSGVNEEIQEDNTDKPKSDEQ